MPRAGLRQRANRGRPRVLTRPGATLSVRGESKPGADHGVQPQDARVPRWIWIMGLRKGTIRHPAPPVRRFERQSVHGGSNAAETGEQTGPEVHLHRFCTDADGNQKQVKTCQIEPPASIVIGRCRTRCILHTAKSAWFQSQKNRGIQLLEGDRKSTRLNSSHLVISYAVFCLKKKNSNVPADSPPTHS